jgi:catechol 2,3-dioxygenase-like lactoylglutathione lyase family enzyme
MSSDKALPERPGRTGGLRHVALYCDRLEDCERFYVDMLGMSVEWRPDADNIYLTSGNDNLALHRSPDGYAMNGDQHLDHIGFILQDIDVVDAWHDFFVAHGVRIVAAPRTHRDGARSFYCHDPDGNTVQLIYHPPIAGT